MKNIKVIVAFAADHLDREADKATLEDRVDDLSKLNQRVHSGGELFKLWAEAKGGRAIAMGKGDGIVEVGADHLAELSELKSQFNQAVGSTCSVGVGVKLSEAEKALTYAQRTGGNSIELFSEELEQDLANLQEPEHEDKLFDAFFDKSEDGPVDKKDNSLNRSTVKNAGGGMTGAHEPSRAAPMAPEEPEQGADETSENAALAQTLEAAPPADLGGQFSQLAEQSEQKEGEEKQAKADQAQDEEDSDNLRSAVVEVLKQFKEQAPLWEQLKEANPDAYKTLTATMQAMVALARKAFMEDGDEGGDEQQEQPVQKAEIPLAPPPSSPPMMHSNVETFMGALKALPKVGPERGKFITSHMHHAPFLNALSVHPQGQQVKTMLHGFLNSKANAGVGVGAKVVAKAALEAGLTGRHQVNYPVGTQIDGAPNAQRERVGRIKILDRNTQKTKWRQVRAGVVQDPLGNPTSSRNPTGGVKPEDIVH